MTGIVGKRILLIVSGGIAAYKALDLIRRLRADGAEVQCVLTAGGAQFVTALSLGALSEKPVYDDLFSLKDEAEMGHIRLSRDADLVVVAPASADLLAKMATGRADDLAGAVLLAADKQILAAPAMNVRMWLNAATQDNLATLKRRGVLFVGPNEGDMACGEFGPGRMAEPEEIVQAVAHVLGGAGRLAGRRALVTSGPTHEAIDPVRFLANASSGRQGHAIAAALARMGAATTLVAGPTAMADPSGVETVHITSARDMLAACENALPADVAVCAAAVSDWRVADVAPEKRKKNGAPPALELVENPDVLATLSAKGNQRPRLVVGFAAETENVVANAQAKLARKGCDWVMANDVSADKAVFGGEENQVHLISGDGVETWPRMSKDAVAAQLAERIATALAEPDGNPAKDGGAT